MVAISDVVIGEYRYGIGQSRYRLRYERWLENMVADCRILDVDKQTAAPYAEIREELKRSGQPISANDLWMAALTRQHAMPLVSRDRHFDRVKRLKRMDW